MRHRLAVAIAACALMLTLTGCPATPDDGDQPSTPPHSAELSPTDTVDTVDEQPPSVDQPPEQPAEPEEPQVVYANCTEAREAGAAPLHEGDPGWNPDMDRDGDGTACE